MIFPAFSKFLFSKLSEINFSLSLTDKTMFSISNTEARKVRSSLKAYLSVSISGELLSFSIAVVSAEILSFLAKFPSAI